jgi:hypothetical protein
MALGSKQPLREMSTSLFPWGKGDRFLRLTTLALSCAVVMNSKNLKFLIPSVPLQACNGTSLPLTFSKAVQSVGFLVQSLHYSINVEIDRA